MPNRNKQTKFDGPIPGENFTSDTKNYPWHRPPKYTSFPDVVDAAVKNLNKPDRTAFVIAMLETDQTIVDIVTGMIRIGVAQGRMSIDMGILAAGPIARMIEVIAEKAEIDFERGWEQEPRVVTSELLKAMGAKASEEDADMSILEDDVPEPEEGEEGLMAMTDEPAPEEEQTAMLGAEEDEEIV
jgi:hypothetical protein